MKVVHLRATTVGQRGQARRVATRSTGKGHVAVIVANVMCHATRFAFGHGFSSFYDSSSKIAQDRVDSRRWDR